VDEPDLVILDLLMPVINGWEVLDTLRSCRQSLPVVVLSAIPADGCADYIQKPISLDRLLELLSKVRARVAAHAARG
jgi:CheY-like chemotaxis protein